MTNILSDHLKEINDSAESESEKGKHFEEIVKIFLENDATQTQQYSRVWRFADWAKAQGIPATDTGIDLVAELRDESGLCAVQCKFYDSDTAISKPAIDSFITASDGAKFTRRVLADTTDKGYGKYAERTIDNLEKPWNRITLETLEKSQIKWDVYIKHGETELKPGKTPHPHQLDAIKAVTTGFADTDRGKMIMACGTGKTFTALRIAEDMGGAGKIVLYMVPSLALMSQTVREWKYDARQEFRAFSVCSDSKVGKKNEDDMIDLRPSDLFFPATTKAKTIAKQVKNAPNDQMIVVFSTYQSIDVLARAQGKGLPEFDLIICDEAHRTTGVSLKDEKDNEESHFIRIHNNEYVKGGKRLYMTATPKIFGEKARARAQDHDAELSSMDDIEKYGTTFYTKDFSSAVEDNLLSDYKVIVLAVDEGLISAGVQNRLAESDILTLDDITKIIGCYKALNKSNLTDDDEQDLNQEHAPMRRAVAFCKSIIVSKDITKEFPKVVEEYLNDETVSDKEIHHLNVETAHVDGTFNAHARDKELNWLRAETEGATCRVLTNVRCLSEGVDVPALDAIMFMHPRNSQIEVVQAVGRVMRKAEGKEMGYVILPVAIKAGASAAEALDKNETYRVVWQILNALRAHDMGLDRSINQIRLGETATDKIEIMGLLRDFDGTAIQIDSVNLKKRKDKKRMGLGGGGGGESDSDGTNPDEEEAEEQYVLFDEFARAIRAKIVDKCGTREYWDTWARDIARIAQAHIVRITAIIAGNAGAGAAFNAFLAEIHDDLNPEVTESEAIEMLAQHLITKPVFDTLFKDNEFTSNNPVSRAMELVLTQLDEHNLEKESESLAGFYASVQRRADGIKTAEGRQNLVVELYDRFFRAAFPTLTQKLGIVYTPTEVVDFIIHSVNDVLKSEFNKTLGEQNVHILDPFTGTGTFITRLLQSGLITAEQMEYKYKNEIHANEIVLLAYYIAAINIESVYHGLMAETQEYAPLTGDVLPYTPFEGIVLTDTFQLYEQEKDMVANLMPDNSERRTAQKSRDIRVIFGNPPYSAGQQSENDDAKNVEYKNLDYKLQKTYSDSSLKRGGKRSLYNSYIRAFRWASDRLQEKGDDAGVVAFVSGSAWIERSFADGLRKCLKEEFSSLYVFHLRGDARKNMLSKGVAREGENVFGQGSMTGIAISVLVRNPDAKEQGKIYFHDIGNDLKTEQKLTMIKRFKSIDGITARGGWREIIPDEHHDWIYQRDPRFENYIEIGNKKDTNLPPIFTNYSNGVVTNRDAWVYNASGKALEDNMKRMIDFYNSEVERYADSGEGQKIGSFVSKDSKKISWGINMKAGVKNNKKRLFQKDRIFSAIYRPFTKRWLYADRHFVHSLCSTPNLFPSPSTKNRIIAVSGVGARAGFSVLMTDCLPDIQLIDNCQSFPLKLYDAPSSGDLLNSKTTDYTEQDGISDAGLKHFQTTYPKETISKEDVFYYIYGLLHSNDYYQRFENNLLKELPRIPAVKTAADFWKFSKAGRQLGDLHVNYENAAPYPINVKEHDMLTEDTTFPPSYYRVEKMKFAGSGKNKDKSIVHYNDNITITNIPLAAYDYIVNGRAALEWVMDRQGVKTDKNSGIVNDANDYATETMNDAEYPLKLFQRVLTVSLETMKIVNALPPLDID